MTLNAARQYFENLTIEWFLQGTDCQTNHVPKIIEVYFAVKWS